MTNASPKPLIAIIDDDWINRELMETVLKRHGFGVCSASTAHSGLKLVQDSQPRGVIVDLRLPDMDGVDVVKAIRAMPLPYHITIVVMSAMDDLAVRSRCLDAGADRFHSKVFAIADLISQMKELIPAE